MANCRECGAELVGGENWYPSLAKSRNYICIKCHKAYNRQWREENPDYTHPLIICKECGEEKPHAGHGLCKTCHSRQYEPPLIICKECGEEKPHVAHGLCAACYIRQWREQNPDYDYERPLITCKECGEEKPHAAHGLCKACYKRPLIICKRCGEEKPNHGHGLCKACYQRQWRAENPDHEQPLIICGECGEKKPHAARGLCKTCYDRQYYEKRREHKATLGRQWCKGNPDRARAIKHRYRARKASATIEPVDEQVIYDLYNNTCIYCGATENLELDHIVPLNGEGAHCEDNLVVACRSCNSSKSDTPLIEWLQTRPDLRAWVM